MSTTQQPLDEKTLRVLLVEDSEDDALLIRRHFRQAGYHPFVSRVETAEAMHAALQAGAGSGEEAWDVVLADYNLPTFSAPAALQLLKSAGSDIPFIMMSGVVSEETAVAAMRAGAHDYISKQNLTRLVPAIEREIGEARARNLRRDAELALQASEDSFHRLVEAMPVGLLIYEGSGEGGSEAEDKITYANQAIERLLGYSLAEIHRTGITFRQILQPSDQATLARMRASLVVDARVTPFEAVCRTLSGNFVPMLIGLTMLRTENTAQQQQAAVFFIDLSEQKRSEEILRRTEKLAATGRLAASIAHEINNPLEAVMNCLYLLNTDDLNGSSREYLNMAQRELDRVTHITTQTLRFYRQSTRPVQANVNELFDTVLALYEARVRNFGIQVERQYGSIPTITVFEGEVRQVLAHLVGNAVDAMHNTGGRLILRTSRGHNWKTGASGIVISVADEGCGMDRATLLRIFEPFFSTKGITGTGLGLWVSQSILEKHDGQVHVRSRLAKPGAVSGTVFRVFLPLMTGA